MPNVLMLKQETVKVIESREGTVYKGLSKLPKGVFGKR